MNIRIRKLIGVFAMIAFLVVYAAAAIILADKLPQNKLIQGVYFVFAGLFWIVPLMPLLSWMHGPKIKRG